MKLKHNKKNSLQTTLWKKLDTDNTNVNFDNSEKKSPSNNIK